MESGETQVVSGIRLFEAAHVEEVETNGPLSLLFLVSQYGKTAAEGLDCE